MQNNFLYFIWLTQQQELPSCIDMLCHHIARNSRKWNIFCVMMILYKKLSCLDEPKVLFGLHQLEYFRKPLQTNLISKLWPSFRYKNYFDLWANKRTEVLLLTLFNRRPITFLSSIIFFLHLSQVNILQLIFWSINNLYDTYIDL